MKKYILIFMMMFGMLFAVSSSCKAQTYYYKTYEFAIKFKSSYGVWGNWSDWEKSNIVLTIDMDQDVITVFSQQKQIYKVIEYLGSYTDESGGKQLKYYVIDQDGDLGHVRLRNEKNGNSQIYIDFNDVMWVYNVKRM